MLKCAVWYVERLRGDRFSVVNCMQRTVLEAENDLNKVSRRPGGRFNVIQCSPVLEEATTANPEEQTQNRREVVARYTLPSDPNVVLTLRYGTNHVTSFALVLYVQKTCVAWKTMRTRVGV